MIQSRWDCGARVGTTRSTAPARTAGLDCKVPRPGHALRAEPRLGIGTIRAPGGNVVAVCKDRRAGPADDDKNSLGATNDGRRRKEICFDARPHPGLLPRGEGITSRVFEFSDERPASPGAQIFKQPARVSPSPWGEGRDE